MNRALCRKHRLTLRRVAFTHAAELRRVVCKQRRKLLGGVFVCPRVTEDIWEIIEGAVRFLAGEERGGGKLAALFLFFFRLTPGLLGLAHGCLGFAPGLLRFFLLLPFLCLPLLLFLPPPLFGDLRRLVKDPGPMLLFPEHQHRRLVVADLAAQVPVIEPVIKSPLCQAIAVKLFIVPAVGIRFGRGDTHFTAVTVLWLKHCACRVGCGDEILHIGALHGLFCLFEDICRKQNSPLFFLLGGKQAFLQFTTTPFLMQSFRTILSGFPCGVNPESRIK